MFEKAVSNPKNTLFSSNKNWKEIILDTDFTAVFLSEILEKHIQKQPWYGEKPNQLKHIELNEYFKIQQDGEIYFKLILKVNFVEAFCYHYFLPIAFVSNENSIEKSRILPIELKNKKGFIVDKTPIQYQKLESFQFTNWVQT